MQSPSLTQAMSQLHTWTGLILGWVLFAIFLTGTLAVFDRELSWWMQPELRAAPADAGAAAAVGQRWLTERHADAAQWNLTLPTARTPVLEVAAGERRRGGGQPLDTVSGEQVQPRQTVGGNFFFRLHYTLHLPRNIGIWVVGLAAMAMLVALISGIVIHKKIFREFFTFRPGKGQRSWLDGHNATGVLLLPFHLMITYTGLAIFFLVYMPAALDALYGGEREAMQRDGRPGAASQQQAQATAGKPTGEADREGRHEGGHTDAREQAPAAELLPLSRFVGLAEARYGSGMIAGLSVRNPGRADAEVTARPLLGNRIELTKGEGITWHGVTGELLQAPAPSRPSLLTQRVMAGLHFAQFGGVPMRWLYFFCGLGSCAMIATGLALYTVKQRRQARRPVEVRWLQVAERINVAAVAGLGLACVALLWGNRLLPVALAERAAMESRLFFGIWLLTLVHASLRAPLRAWREQLWAAALLCLLLPVLDLVGAQSPIDTLRLGVDATAAASGVLLGWVAHRIRPQPVPVRQSRRRSAANAATVPAAPVVMEGME